MNTLNTRARVSEPVAAYFQTPVHDPHQTVSHPTCTVNSMDLKRT